MVVTGKIKIGAYFDSVTLMRCGQRLAGMAGVADAATVMGTRSNVSILRASGLLISQFEAARDTDLLIAVRAEDAAAAAAALAAADGVLAEARKISGESAETQPASLESALQVLPGANLALISVAGRYAGDVAMAALEHGLHVMLFSDNVPIETEIELKQFARDRGLLVMGPDCGTAIINGTPLGFANAVPRGSIGIVAAAGTGLQEVSCIIANRGAGVSEAIGTGGRDVKREVGGIMSLAALKVLADDENTKVILLVSKPPDGEVLQRISATSKDLGKPVVTMFVGGAAAGGPTTLEEAALTAVALASGEHTGDVAKKLAFREAQLRQGARAVTAKRKPGQKYVRGLFSGGTFCAEAQALLRDKVAGVFSNTPNGVTQTLDNALVSQKNSLVDLGEDEFTQGRLHPMMDYTLRKRRILQEAADPETAVVLLDVVLGYGAHPDPAAELVPVLREACAQVAVLCSVTGTDKDPQNRSATIKRLQEAGAIVMESNAAACKLAGYIAQVLGASATP
jgi:FdrA protein